MKNSIFAKIGCLVLYTGAIVLGILNGMWLPFIIIAALHFVEFIVIGKKTGDAAGIPAMASFVICMLFGITWWKPLREKLQRKEN